MSSRQFGKQQQQQQKAALYYTFNFKYPLYSIAQPEVIIKDLIINIHR